MKTKQLPEYFKRYEHELKVLWRLFQKHNNRITQQHFDKIFPDSQYKRWMRNGKCLIRRMRQPSCFLSICGPNFGWTGIGRPITPWGMYLEIIQHLMQFGITTVDGKKSKGNLVYRFIKKPKLK